MLSNFDSLRLTNLQTRPLCSPQRPHFLLWAQEWDVCERNGANFWTCPGRCSLTAMEIVPESSSCWSGSWEEHLGEGISLKNEVSFLASWDPSPRVLFLLSVPPVLSRKEAQCFMFIPVLPQDPWPSFGKLTATSHCRALDRMEAGLTHTREFPCLKP